METFNFPYHRVGDKYPESSTKVSMGGGYEFASRPRGPDQMQFKLTFAAMWFYETAGKVDAVRFPQRNMRVLEAFYERHRLYQPFLYPHSRRGLVVCRFRVPLETPDGIATGNGQTQEFSIELISQP